MESDKFIGEKEEQGEEYIEIEPDMGLIMKLNTLAPFLIVLYDTEIKGDFMKVKNARFCFDKAREIAEKKAVINTYWDYPEAIWQFEWLIRFDDLRLEIMDDERDIAEGLTEIAEREGLTNDYEAIREYVNKTVSPIFEVVEGEH